MDIKKVLAIGGSDPCGGAGIQADMKTLIELGVYPYTVVSAITAQNSSGVRSTEVLTAKLLRDQIETIFEDTDIHAVKTGMLGTSENILELAGLLRDRCIQYSVIDPVTRASDGRVLTPDASIAVLRKRLLPLSFMVTPNTDEATLLTGVRIKNESDLLTAAKILKESGVKWVLVKGGHLAGNAAIDLLYDGEKEYYFEVDRIRSENVRGTGCMMASAICAHLVQGLSPRTAVDKAKSYVSNKIRNAVALGKGSLQATHFCTSEGEQTREYGIYHKGEPTGEQDANQNKEGDVIEDRVN